MKIERKHGYEAHKIERVDVLILLRRHFERQRQQIRVVIVHVAIPPLLLRCRLSIESISVFKLYNLTQIDHTLLEMRYIVTLQSIVLKRLSEMYICQLSS